MDTFIHISENILHYLVEAGVIILELFGVAILLYTSISCFIRWLRKDEAVSLRLGQGIALGLEFKLGGEVLRTVITREKDELIILGAIILLRGVLTVLIHWEIKTEEEALEKKMVQASHAAATSAAEIAASAAAAAASAAANAGASPEAAAQADAAAEAAADAAEAAAHAAANAESISKI